MAIKTYSVKQSGAALLSQNFRVREFACKDGSDAVLIDLDLVTTLQKIRDHFKTPITNNSAYRTTSHNKKVGGSTKPKHLEGRAADIVVVGVEPLKVCRYAESIGAKGIGRYNSFAHVDTRTSKYYWDCRTGAEKAVSSFGGKPIPFRQKLLKGAAAATTLSGCRHNSSPMVTIPAMRTAYSARKPTRRYGRSRRQRSWLWMGLLG